jgi:hypothetical protein
MQKMAAYDLRMKNIRLNYLMASDKKRRRKNTAIELEL